MTAKEDLYARLVRYGFARLGGLVERCLTVRAYDLLMPPMPVCGTNRLAIGEPFNMAAAEELGVPYTLMPTQLIEEAWAALSHCERRCLSSLYAFVSPSGVEVDPNHLYFANGHLIASDGFMKAAGCGQEIQSVLTQLQNHGLLSSRRVKLAAVPLFPGSRPPLIIDECGDVDAQCFVLALPSPAKRKRRRKKVA